MSPVAAIVNAPALVMVTGPELIVVMGALITKLFPVKEMPEAPVVFTAPLNVVVALPVS
jgi:hypothetical protein